MADEAGKLDPLDVLHNLETTARAEAQKGHVATAPEFYAAIADFAAMMKEHALEREFPHDAPTNPGGATPSATTPA